MIIEVKVPSPGEAISEVELGGWLVEDGAIVDMDDELVEVMSDKATLIVGAESEGQVKILKEAGEVVAVGEVIATIDTEAAGDGGSDAGSSNGEAKAESSEKAPALENEAAAGSGKENYATGTPSVSAKKLMDEKGVDQGAVQGTGRDGRVTKTDVVEHLKNPPAKESAPEKKAASESKSEPQSAPAPNLGGSREVSRKRMTPMRRSIAARLVSVKNETAMLTTFNEVDMHNILEIRKKYKDKFKERYGVGLGFMGFFAKAVCEAMNYFPAINAQIDGDDMVSHDYVDLGIAVSTPKGLVVPNIRNCESLSILGIEQAIRDYALKARDGKITIEDMTGGTFTITNGGVFGSMLSTPIINPPQSAILGMHNIVERPVAINGEVVIRPIMYVALSYDHRIVDGKEAVSFLYKVKEFLEDPTRLLIGI